MVLPQPDRPLPVKNKDHNVNVHTEFIISVFHLLIGSLTKTLKAPSVSLFSLLYTTVSADSPRPTTSRAFPNADKACSFLAVQTVCKCVQILLLGRPFVAKMARLECIAAFRRW